MRKSSLLRSEPLEGFDSRANTNKPWCNHGFRVDQVLDIFLNLKIMSAPGFTPTSSQSKATFSNVGCDACWWHPFPGGLKGTPKRDGASPKNHTPKHVFPENPERSRLSLAMNTRRMFGRCFWMHSHKQNRKHGCRRYVFIDLGRPW